MRGREHILEMSEALLFIWVLVWACIVAGAYIPLTVDQDAVPYEYNEIFGETIGTGVLGTDMHPIYSELDEIDKEKTANGLGSDTDDGFYMTSIVKSLRTSPDTSHSWDEIKRAQGRTSRTSPDRGDNTPLKSGEFIYGKPSLFPDTYLANIPPDRGSRLRADRVTNITLVDYRMVTSLKDWLDENTQQRPSEVAQWELAINQDAIDQSLSSEEFDSGNQGSGDQTENLYTSSLDTTVLPAVEMRNSEAISEAIQVEGVRDTMNKIDHTVGHQNIRELGGNGNPATKSLGQSTPQSNPATESMTVVPSSETKCPKLPEIIATDKTMLRQDADYIQNGITVMSHALPTQSANINIECIKAAHTQHALTHDFDSENWCLGSRGNRSSDIIAAPDMNSPSRGILSERLNTAAIGDEKIQNHQMPHKVNGMDDHPVSDPLFDDSCGPQRQTSDNCLATIINEVEPESSEQPETPVGCCEILTVAGDKVDVSKNVPAAASGGIEATKTPIDTYLPMAGEIVESDLNFPVDHDTNDLEMTLENIADYDSVYDYFKSNYFVEKFRMRVLIDSEVLQSFEPQSEWGDERSQEKWEEESEVEEYSTRMGEDVEGIDTHAVYPDRLGNQELDMNIEDIGEEREVEGNSSREGETTDEFAEAHEKDHDAIKFGDPDAAFEVGVSIENSNTAAEEEMDFEGSNASAEDGTSVEQVTIPIRENSVEHANTTHDRNGEEETENIKAVFGTELDITTSSVGLSSAIGLEKSSLIHFERYSVPDSEWALDDEECARNNRQDFQRSNEIYKEEDDNYEEDEDHLDSAEHNSGQNNDSITDEELEQLMVEYEQWRYDALSVAAGD